jgi:hypothetical protein
LNTDVAIPPTETDSPPLETITIPEIVEAMIKSVEEKNFVESLQDVGTQVQVKKGNKKVLVTTFRELQTFAGQLRKAGWEPIKQKEKCLPNFLSKLNISCICDEIAELINLKRKKVSIKNISSTVQDIYLATSPKNQTELYALFPENPELQLTTYFENKLFNYEESSKKPASSKVTSNNAARLVAILLDKKYRTAITQCLKKMQPRQVQDQGTNPKIGLFEDVVDDFNDPDFVAISPEDTGDLVWDPPVDPNDVSHFLCLLFVHLFEWRLLSKSNWLQPSRVGLNRDAKFLEQQLWVGYIVP